MFTALVTFLVAVTMILGGAGSPVDVILDSLSIDLATVLEVDPVEEDPVEAETPKGNQYKVSTGQEEGFEPPPSPEPEPIPSRTNNDCVDDELCPDPVRDRVRDRDPIKEQLGNGPYYGEKAPESDPVEAPEEAALVDEPPPVEEELPGNRPDEAGAGKPIEVAPDPQPDPEPEPGPEPAPDPTPKDCETDDSCPAPEPQPEPEPEPVPNLGAGPVTPNPAPSPDCEDDSCPAPEPAPEQPATGGGEGDGSETGGSEDVENGKP